MTAILVRTNRPEYMNDIAEELRLHIAEAQVVPCEGCQYPQDGDIMLSAMSDRREDGFYAKTELCAPQGTFEYSYFSPFSEGSELEAKRVEKRALKISVFRAMKNISGAYTPWGSLTGIRPTRLYRELTGYLTRADADAMMLHEFDVSKEKLALVNAIHDVQAPFVGSVLDSDAGVYIGVPFCKTRCLYCSFASEVVGKRTDLGAYIAALKADIAVGARTLDEAGMRVRSMYMGGGTPTVLSAEQLEDVLSFAAERYGGFGSELTVEAGRPDTIDEGKLAALKRLGVSRISINPQSMNEETLKLIGRSHTPEDIGRAFAMARDAGFDNINMDVIAGLPGENTAAFRNTLERITELRPESLTVHTLAIKRSSRLRERLEEYPLPAAQEADAMVRLGRECAKQMGMRPYYMYRQKYMSGNLENVGYALPQRESVYNIDMMEETSHIMAHGAGAISKRLFGGEQRVERIPNPKDIATYTAKQGEIALRRNELFCSLQ